MTKVSPDIISTFTSESVPIGLCIVDQDFRYVWVNTAFERLLGFPASELLGHSFIEFTHPDDIEHDQEFSLRAFDGQDPYFSTRKRFIRKSGEVLLADMLATVVPDANNGAARGLAILTDAGEGDPVTRQIELLQRAAVAGQLAAGAAHDLRNSMCAIRLLAETLSTDGSHGASIQLLQAETDAALEVVDSIIHHAAPSGVESNELALIDLLSSAEALLDLVTPAGTSLHIDLAPKELYVRVGSSEFRQVLLNLVLNARDATAMSGGSIRVETEVTIGDADFVDIRVVDDGLGMSPAELERSFEPYYTTKGNDGTGLGLSVSREIIERNRGTLLARSTSGKGSTFTIRLPLVRRSD